MNILIKNADFSEVSIGKVETMAELEKKSILKNVYFSSASPLTMSYIVTGLKIFAVDVSELNQKEIEIRGLIGGSKVLGAFFGETCPTTSIEFADQTEVTNFQSNYTNNLGVLSYPEESGGSKIKTVIVPNGAKTLFVYAGDLINNCNVKYSLID